MKSDMRRLLSIASLLLAGCFPGSEDGPEGLCGPGTHEFTRYHGFDSRDSIIRTVVVNPSGDTVSLDLFEFDSAGEILKSIWIHGSEKSGKDTGCLLHHRSEDGKRRLSVYCEDTSRMFSLSTFNEKGQLSSQAFYNGSTFDSESFFTYDESGLLMRIEIIFSGEKFLVDTYSYDAKGNWTGTESFDRAGALTSRTMNTMISSTRTRTDVLDSAGRLRSWEINYLNRKSRIEKSVACKSKDS